MLQWCWRCTAPYACCGVSPAVLLLLSTACYRLQRSSVWTDVGTIFVVERQHLHALCSLSTPTSAEGGAEEEGGGKNFLSVCLRETESAALLPQTHAWWGGCVGVCVYVYVCLYMKSRLIRCDFSGNVMHFFVAWTVDWVYFILIVVWCLLKGFCFEELLAPAVNTL